MRRISIAVALVICLAVTGIALAQMGGSGKPGATDKSDFAMTASYIESCTCDMFCPCYFNTRPTHHHGSAARHFCSANLILKVDKGHYKTTDLTGVKVWIANDLGGDFTTGAFDWLVLIWHPAVTEPQKAAMRDILLQLYPPHKKSKHLGEDTIDFTWNIDEKAGVAQAKLADGKGETTLERVKGDVPGKEVVMQNLTYFGAQSNTGFRMWKAKRNYYEGHGKKYDTSGTNGFLITINFSGKASTPATAD